MILIAIKVHTSIDDTLAHTKFSRAYTVYKIRRVLYTSTQVENDLSIQADQGQDNEHLTFYIIDNHRPVNLANIFDANASLHLARVLVLDDGQVCHTNTYICMYVCMCFAIFVLVHIVQDIATCCLTNK